MHIQRDSEHLSARLFVKHNAMREASFVISVSLGQRRPGSYATTSSVRQVVGVCRCASPRKKVPRERVAVNEWASNFRRSKPFLDPRAKLVLVKKRFNICFCADQSKAIFFLLFLRNKH